MNGEKMNESHGSLIDVLKNVFGWIFVVAGHALDNATLANVALLTSIIYSVVNIVVILERRRKHAKED